MKRQAYIRHSTILLQQGLHAIRENITRMTARQPTERYVFNGERVNAESLRLRTFAVHGTRCVGCGLEGAFFALEKSHGSTPSFHMNLYALGQDQQEILMTHDHIKARCLGGKDNLTNTQTMCGPCNWAKGDIERQIKKRQKR